MHNHTALDASIRSHAATRAQELGGAPYANDIDIEWAALESPPDTRLFRAYWIDRSGQRGLTGVWIEGDINSYPLNAIDCVLRRWRDTTGHLPHAEVVASVCAFLLDADSSHRALIGPKKDWPEAVPPALRQRLHEPIYIGDLADLPLAFWWLHRNDRLLRVEIGRDRDGRIIFEVAPLQDWIDRQGGEPSA